VAEVAALFGRAAGWAAGARCLARDDPM